MKSITLILLYIKILFFYTPTFTACFYYFFCLLLSPGYLILLSSLAFSAVELMSMTNNVVYLSILVKQIIFYDLQLLSFYFFNTLLFFLFHIKNLPFCDLQIICLFSQAFIVFSIWKFFTCNNSLHPLPILLELLFSSFSDCLYSSL